MTLGPLTFLAPIAGAIAGAIALPALLLWYFLKLRRRPVRVSSTFLWTSAAADLQVNVPFRWIRPSWLLLLQLLVLLALIAAIARPAVEGAGGPGARVVIMIDRSASMAALDGAPDSSGARRSRLEEAGQQALRIIDQLGDGAEAMVVTVAARPEAMTNLTRDRGQLRRAVESVQQTDQPGDLDAALRLVSNTTSRSDAEGSEPPRVVLLSDGSFERRGDAGGASGGLGRADFQFVRAGPPSPDTGAEPADSGTQATFLGFENAGIVAMAARRGYEDPASVTLFIRIQNAAAREFSAGLTVQLDGTTIEARALNVPPATPDAPGEQSVRIEFASAEGGVLTAALGRPDLLESDNAAGIVLKPPRGAAILVVQPNVPSSVTDYLPIDALQSLGPRLLTPVTFAQYERMAARAEGARPLSDYSLVVFDRVRPATLPPLPSLSFGAGLPISGLIVTRPEAGDRAGAPGPFIYWQRSHPVLRFVNLGVVNVAAPMKITLPDPDAPREGPPMKIDTLASGSGGPLIIMSEESGLRRVVVGFELADSQWWQDPGFPVFIKNVVDHLTLASDDAAGRALTTVDTATLRPISDARAIEIRGPTQLTRQRDEAGWAGSVTLGPFPLAGLYQASGVVAEDQPLAVNLLDPFESRLETRERVLLGGQSIATSAAGSGGLREVWQWFIAAAAALIALEWFIYVWRMRV